MLIIYLLCQHNPNQNTNLLKKCQQQMSNRNWVIIRLTQADKLKLEDLRLEVQGSEE